MIHNIRGCIAKCSIGIIPKCHHSRFGSVVWEEIFWPERFCVGVRPGFNRISIEAMDEDDVDSRG